MNYTSSFKRSGTIRDTPLYIVKHITRELNVNTHRTILEFGPGLGAITDDLYKKSLQTNIDYKAVEFNEEFVSLLHGRYPTIKFYCEDAFAFLENNISKNEKFDFVVCNLPLSYFPRIKVLNFLNGLKKITTPNGKIVVMYHAPWLTTLMQKAYPKRKLKFFLTLPPYFIVIPK